MAQVPRELDSFFFRSRSKITQIIEIFKIDFKREGKKPERNMKTTELSIL